MKVIDLLNKIANNEEVPKKIKWEDTIFAYSDYDKDYLEFPFSEEEYKGLFCMKDCILTQYLDDEIEIIEEKPKKIRQIPTLTYDGSSKAMKIHILKSHLEKTIEAVNYLLEKESDK